MHTTNTPRPNQAQSSNNLPPNNRQAHYADKTKSNAETPAIPLSARWQILMARRLPWQLDPEEAATILGFKNRETILELEKLGMLKALGNPGEKCDRYFSLVEIDALGADPERLHKARKLLREARNKKEAVRKAKLEKERKNGKKPKQ